MMLFMIFAIFVLWFEPCTAGVRTVGTLVAGYDVEHAVPKLSVQLVDSQSFISSPSLDLKFPRTYFSISAEVLATAREERKHNKHKTQIII